MSETKNEGRDRALTITDLPKSPLGPDFIRVLSLCQKAGVCTANGSGQQSRRFRGCCNSRLQRSWGIVSAAASVVVLGVSPRGDYRSSVHTPTSGITKKDTQTRHDDLDVTTISHSTNFEFMMNVCSAGTQMTSPASSSEVSEIARMPSLSSCRNGENLPL
jgi:hypothetical protein